MVKIKKRKTNLDNIPLLSEAHNGIDLICHCAGVHGLHNVDINTHKQYFKNNVIGTQNLYKKVSTFGMKFIERMI